jgi:uncharacterized protein YwgA
LAGLENGFRFDYHHYGPYSEELATATATAHALGYIKEEEKQTSWGGWYSVYTKNKETPCNDTCSERRELAKKAVAADSTVLELAATAAYFSARGIQDPWEETRLRKPDKTENGRLEEAKLLYSELKHIAPGLPSMP